jgi:hypothetical protein
LRLIANHHVNNLFNQKRGIIEILSEQQFLDILIMSLASPLLTSRTATVEFLLVIATSEYPKGHRLVMSSLEHLKLSKGDDFKTRVFDFLVLSLKDLVFSRGIFGSKVNQSKLNEVTLFSINSDKTTQPTESDIRSYLVYVYL